jgi:hypothetical protein
MSSCNTQTRIGASTIRRSERVRTKVSPYQAGLDELASLGDCPYVSTMLHHGVPGRMHRRIIAAAQRLEERLALGGARLVSNLSTPAITDNLVYDRVENQMRITSLNVVEELSEYQGNTESRFIPDLRALLKISAM